MVDYASFWLDLVCYDLLCATRVFCDICAMDSVYSMWNVQCRAQCVQCREQRRESSVLSEKNKMQNVKQENVKYTIQIVECEVLI